MIFDRIGKIAPRFPLDNDRHTPFGALYKDDDDDEEDEDDDVVVEAQANATDCYHSITNNP